MSESFPFFVGRGRSGTTLVRAIFDSHSQMAIPNESYFVAFMAVNRHRYELEGTFLLDKYIEELSMRPGVVSWGLDMDALRQHLYEIAPSSLADAIRATYGAYADSQGKPRYGDKTPVYVMAISPLARLFPESRFIHVVRDGRDSALSYMDVPWGPPTIDEAAFRWRRAVTRARQAGQLLGPARYFELRYEELVADPEAVVKDTCKFVGLSFEAGMLKYFERADQVTAQMGYPQTRAGLYKPVASGMRDWRTQMSASDVARFEAIAGPTLASYGYPRSSRRVAFPIRLAAWSQVGRVLVRNRLRAMEKGPARQTGPEPTKSPDHD
jgi:Sulfotransferase family